MSLVRGCGLPTDWRGWNGSPRVAPSRDIPHEGVGGLGGSTAILDRGPTVVPGGTGRP